MVRFFMFCLFHLSIWTRLPGFRVQYSMRLRSSDVGVYTMRCGFEFQSADILFERNDFFCWIFSSRINGTKYSHMRQKNEKNTLTHHRNGTFSIETDTFVPIRIKVAMHNPYSNYAKQRRWERSVVESSSLFVSNGSFSVSDEFTVYVVKPLQIELNRMINIWKSQWNQISVNCKLQLNRMQYISGKNYTL